MEPLCCQAKRATDIHVRDLAPYHLAAYVRIYSLFLTGGVFSDFTWIHVNAIPTTVERGVYIRENCLPDIREKSTNCYFSSIYVFRTEKDPVLKCMLDAYGDALSPLLTCVPVLQNKDPTGSGAMCVKQSFHDCFISTGLSNQLQSASYLIRDFNSSDSSFMSTGESLHQLWWGIEGNSTMNSLHKSAAIWLGPSATKSNWDVPTPSSFLWSIIEAKITLTRNNVAKFIADKCKGHNFHTTKQLSCSHYYVDPQKSLIKNKETSQASSSCALTFMIPGFMKAGTTFLFDTLGRHPQVLMALKGVAFKETGCYLGTQMSKSRRMQRMNCYPFVEPVSNTTGKFTKLLYRNKQQLLLTSSYRWFCLWGWNCILHEQVIIIMKIIIKSIV
jgi:hypothetical protein